MKYQNKDYDNAPFYKGRAWRKASRAYMQGKLWICERCNAPATICHHRIWLNGANINNLDLALGADNLEALCHACHNQEHASKNSKVFFDEFGQVEGVKESAEINEFKAAQIKIDEMLAKFRTEKQAPE